jgi:hypothetical protein
MTDREAIKIAEAIVRPYLTQGAIYGVLPDHRFRENVDGLPMKLVGDIVEALLEASKQ